MVAKFFKSILDKKPIQVHGDGEQTRDFSYIEDVVDATLSALFSVKAEGQVYNVGSGFETTINRLVDMIMQITGFEGKIKYIDRRDIDNIRRRVMNIEKIRRDLRWIPQHTLEKGLKKTWAWIQEEYGGGDRSISLG